MFILTGRMETAAKHGVRVYRRRMEYVQQVHQLQVSITWAVCRAGVQCHRLTAINRHQMHDFLQTFLLVTARQTSHSKKGSALFSRIYRICKIFILQQMFSLDMHSTKVSLDRFDENE